MNKVPYEVLVDGATVQHVVGDAYNADGEVVGEETRSVIHHAGDEIADEELPKHLKDAYASGDEHVLSHLKKTFGAASKAEKDDE